MTLLDFWVKLGHTKDSSANILKEYYDEEEVKLGYTKDFEEYIQKDGGEEELKVRILDFLVKHSF